MKWIALITLGCFCALSSYSYGIAERDGILSGHRGRIAKPVIITRIGPPTHEAACGLKWKCLQAWAEEEHAPSRRH